ncbi:MULTISPECIES: hypothetical protein [unclassified Saccharothrix]|uniref:hypothetical protein n=1 Tax=unclassified Saccharothrix TaxID=2593673 RepID=UPI00307FBF67
MPVAVTVTDGVAPSTVVPALERAGMAVDRVLDALGVVTGTAPEGAIATLCDLPGVSHVERQRQVGLPGV